MEQEYVAGEIYVLWKRRMVDCVFSVVRCDMNPNHMDSKKRNLGPISSSSIVISET